MAENLNYNASGSECYINSSVNCDKYGRLYSWSAAMKACPSGWVLPSEDDWKDLRVAVGGWEASGLHLKTESGWNGSGNGLDTYGFAALPGGRYASSGTSGNFTSIGVTGYWWTSTESVTPSGAATSSAVYVEMYSSVASSYYTEDAAILMEGSKSNSLSVRCVRGSVAVSSSSSALPSSSSSSALPSSSSSSALPSSSSSSALPSSSSRPPSSSSIAISSSSSAARCGNRTETYDTNLYECKMVTPGPSYVIYLKEKVKDSYDNEYNAVLIGTQTWLAENLKSGYSGSVCYNGNSTNCDKYGALFIDGSGFACPMGWRLPSDEDWEILINYAGGASVAGKKLRSSDWSVSLHADRGTNDFGFAALPGGMYRINSPSGQAPIRSFQDIGSSSYWWSSTQVSTTPTGSYLISETHAYGIYGSSPNYLNRTTSQNTQSLITLFYSIRCLKN
jgi:uncharacterized protein (TIGR02145 family)